MSMWCGVKNISPPLIIRTSLMAKTWYLAYTNPSEFYAIDNSYYKLTAIHVVIHYKDVLLQ